MSLEVREGGVSSRMMQAPPVGCNLRAGLRRTFPFHSWASATESAHPASEGATHPRSSDRASATDAAEANRPGLKRSFMHFWRPKDPFGDLQTTSRGQNFPSKPSRRRSSDWLDQVTRATLVLYKHARSYDRCTSGQHGRLHLPRAAVARLQGHLRTTKPSRHQ